MRRVRAAGGVLLLIYLLGLAYLGFRPFHPILGHENPSACAREAPGAASKLWKSLTATGQMMLEVDLRTESTGQGGPARIVSFSRSTMSRNFTLGQSGNGLVFRLRTTETDFDGQHRSLLVPQVFADTDWHRLRITFDGHQVQLFVDGQLHPQTLELGGDFSNWGRNHILVIGDEVTGGRPWHGELRHLAIYDGESAEPVWNLDFQTLEPLRYRNLFITVDPAAYDQDDCILNIFGFIPLAALLWWTIPRLRLWVVGPVGLSISAIIEFAQRGIDRRVPCLSDLICNLLGTLLGVLIIWGMLKVHSKIGINRRSA